MLRRTWTFCLASIVAAAPLAAQSRELRRPATAAPTLAQVTIVGSDYAFLEAPATLPAGETLFAFENRGTVRHEMNLQLMKPGVTLADALRLVAEGGIRRNLMDHHIGVLLAVPKDTAGGRLLARLIPGRTYLVICVLRDTVGAKPHTALGMFTGFTVPERP
jgi:hypothetical protein